MRSADHAGCRGVQLGWVLKGVERCGRGHFPFQTFCSFPWLLRRFFTFAHHARQHDEDKEIRVYDCDICKKRFFNKWSVTRHKKNKHKIQNNPLTSTPTHESGNYSWNWNEPEIMEPGNLLPTGGIKRKIDYTNFPVTTRVYPIKRKKDKKTFEDWGYPVYSKK